MSANETLTPRAAALLLGVRLDSIYTLIWAGKLEADKKDGRWEIPRLAVEARASLRHTRGLERTPDIEIERGISSAIQVQARGRKNDAQ